MPRKVVKPFADLNSTPEQRFRRNFNGVNKPVVKDEFLAKVSDINSDKLSDLMLTFAAWREFTEDLLMEAFADFTRKTELHDHKYDVTLLTTTGNTVKEKEARTRTDLEVRKLFLSLQEAELYYNLLSRKLESYNNCLTVISREITRRTNKDA